MLKRLFFPRSESGFLTLVRLSLRSFFTTGGPTTSAAISYFTLISLFPAFLLVVAVGDMLVRTHERSREVVQQAVAIFPATTRHFILDNLDTMIAPPSWESIITYASIFLWAAMWSFHLLEEALDKAWNVEASRSFWTRKLTNLWIILVSTVLFLGSTTLLATIRFLRPRIVDEGWSVGELSFQILLGLSAYLLMALMVTLIYKILPNTPVCFTEALSGGLIATLIWQLANTIFVWTVPLFHYEVVYGSIWAIVVIVVWVYVSCWIILLGAHMTYHIHRFAGPPAGESPEPPPAARADATGSV
ncbi:MAG TPA: YihY/virulence factor BrkB family protein [Acidobacteriota bacterium]|nr:YihY/virulence factor BrkB family protein [Acidobacteriota bacterium]